MAKEINWYPGHMKKTRELMRESLKIVDASIELLDARIPVSSRNPVIDEILSSNENKCRIILLNKSDLADSKVNILWQERLAEDGAKVFLTDSSSGRGLRPLLDYWSARSRIAHLPEVIVIAESINAILCDVLLP